MCLYRCITASNFSDLYAARPLFVELCDFYTFIAAYNWSVYVRALNLKRFTTPACCMLQSEHIACCCNTARAGLR